jgi:DNA-binding CsgD family transcriptional regulator
MITIFRLLTLFITLLTGAIVFRRAPQNRNVLLAVFALWGITLFTLSGLLEEDQFDYEQTELWLSIIATFAMPAWYHLSCLLLPLSLNKVRLNSARISIPIAYNVVLFVAVGGSNAIEGGLYVSPLYPVLILLVIVFSILSSWNLWSRQRDEPNQIFYVLEDIPFLPCISYSFGANLYTFLMAGTILIHIGGVCLGLKGMRWVDGDMYVVLAYFFQMIGTLILIYPLTRKSTLEPIKQTKLNSSSPIVEVGIPTIIYTLLALNLDALRGTLIGFHNFYLLIFVIVVIAAIHYVGDQFERDTRFFLFVPNFMRKLFTNESEPVFHAKSFISETEKTQVLHDHKITSAEYEVLQLIVNGKMNKEIADERGVSLGTIKNQVSSLMDKLMVKPRKRSALIAKAKELMIVEGRGKIDRYEDSYSGLPYKSTIKA